MRSSLTTKTLGALALAASLAGCVTTAERTLRAAERTATAATDALKAASGALAEERGPALAAVRSAASAAADVAVIASDLRTRLEAPERPWTTWSLRVLALLGLGTAAHAAFLHKSLRRHDKCSVKKN